MGAMVAVRSTVLLNPFVPVTCIVNVVVEPFLTVWEDGLSVIVKSGDGVILNDTITECERLPLFP
jgi:hypothetical protein